MIDSGEEASRSADPHMLLINLRRWRQYSSSDGSVVRGRHMQEEFGQRDGPVVAEGDVERMRVAAERVGTADDVSCGYEGGNEQGLKLCVHVVPVAGDERDGPRGIHTVYM